MLKTVRLGLESYLTDIILESFWSYKKAYSVSQPFFCIYVDHIFHVHETECQIALLLRVINCTGCYSAVFRGEKEMLDQPD
jgi:hypothetical protein